MKKMLVLLITVLFFSCEKNIKDEFKPPTVYLLEPPNNSVCIGELPTFKWSKVERDDGFEAYEIHVSKYSDFPNGYISKFFIHKHESSLGLGYGKYYWRVRAEYTKWGDWTEWSKFLYFEYLKE